MDRTISRPPALPGHQWHADFRFAKIVGKSPLFPKMTNAMRNVDWLMSEPAYGSSAAYGYAMRSAALGPSKMTLALAAFYGNNKTGGEIVNTFGPSGNNAYSGLPDLVILRRVTISNQTMGAQNTTLAIHLPFPDDAM